MTVWIVGGCVLVILLALLKCRAEASYDESGFRWRVAIGPVTLAPRASKSKKQVDKPVEKPEPKAPDIERLHALAELALRLLKRFFKRLRIERLRVHFVSAFDDPYDTAMAYGYAGSAMEAMTALAKGRVRRLDLHTELDFDSSQPLLQAQMVVFVRLGNLILLALSAWRGYRAMKRRAKKEKENEHGKSVDR